MANTENITKWAEALESGEYEQGFNHLTIVELNIAGETVKTSHCCLGVACQVAIKNGVEITVTQGEGDGETLLFYDGESGTLPHKVKEWLGLDEDHGNNPYLGTGSATELNDNEGLNFKQIATQVRETFLEV